MDIDARSELASLFSADGLSLNEDGLSNTERTEFASLFSVDGQSLHDDEVEDFTPHAIQHHQSEDDAMSIASDEGSVVSLSLTQFVLLAKSLAGNEDAVDTFCKFVLTGVYEGQQYQIDPIKHAMGRNGRIKASRDYDSVLGFGKHIYLDCDVTLHPVCKLEDTLRRNIHIKRSFTNIYVRFMLRTSICLDFNSITGRL